MALTALEIEICNTALDRIGASIFTLSNQATSVTGLACARHYEKTRDSLLRSYEWPWASTRAILSQTYLFTLNDMPTEEWEIGDTITGITSGATAQILELNSPSEYKIIYLDGTFEEGETVTNSTVEAVLYNGVTLTWEDEDVVWFETAGYSQVVADSTHPVVATIVPHYKWSFQYRLPEDFLRLREVYEYDCSYPSNCNGKYMNDTSCHCSDRYEIEGQYILTDYDTLNIQYVQKITDPDKFDILFRETLVLRLAMKLVPTLAGTKAPELTADIRDELFRAEGRARCIAGQENNTTGQESFNTARYGR